MIDLAPAPLDPTARARTFLKRTATDWVFAGVMVLTAWWYLRASRGQSFLRDDWRVATRSLSFRDLFEPHNDHLSVVPLAIVPGDARRVRHADVHARALAGQR